MFLYRSFFTLWQDALVIEKKGFHIADDLPFTRNFVEVRNALFVIIYVTLYSAVVVLLYTDFAGR